MSIIVRVQLHHEYNYNELHEAMEERSFARTILSDKGLEYDLPFGTYRYTGNEDQAKALQLAKDAATQARSPAKILVIEGPSRWIGLDLKKA